MIHLAVLQNKACRPPLSSNVHHEHCCFTGPYGHAVPPRRSLALFLQPRARAQLGWLSGYPSRGAAAASSCATTPVSEQSVEVIYNREGEQEHLYWREAPNTARSRKHDAPSGAVNYRGAH